MTMLKRLLCLALCLMTLTFVSCEKNEEPEPERKERTVVFYMVSENSLVSYCNMNIRQLLKSAKSMKNGEEIVLYVDGINNPAIYTINNKTMAQYLEDLTPEYEYPSDVNSCSGVTLTEFLGYVKQHHAADSYGLVLWSHGTGWIPSSYIGDSPNYFARRRSFGLDNGKNTNNDLGHQMPISELHNALKSMGQKFDYILFDCCFMQCVEVDYELSDVAGYIIASPAEIPGPGAPYDQLVDVFFSKNNCARQIADIYYNQYNASQYGVVMSVCDCSQMDAFAEATSKVVLNHKNELLTQSYKNVLDYFDYNQFRSKDIRMPDFYDINGVLKSYVPDTEYAIWKMEFDKAYPVAHSTDSWYSIYPKGRIPVDKGQFGGASMYVQLEKYTKGQYAEGNRFFVEGFPSSQWAKKVWGY